MRRLRAVAAKEVLHLTRDPRSLAAALLLPVALLLLYGYAVDYDLNDLKFCAVDLDRSPASRRILTGLDSIAEFTFVGELDNAAQVDGVFARRRARVAVIIPRGFENELRERREATVQVLVDGTDANVAQTAQAYAVAAIQNVGRRLTLRELRAAGLPEALFAGALEVRARVYYNPDLESKRFLIPGLVGIILIMLSALLTSGVVVREREAGSFELLAASPVSAPELIVGKLLPYVVLAFFDVILTITLGRWVFGVRVAGSVGLLLALSTFYVVSALSMGLLFSCIAKTQQIAMTMAFMATMVPTMVLSGFAFPIRNMPWLLQQMAMALPATHYLVIARGIVLKGAGLDVLWQPTLNLAVITLVLLVVAVRRFRKTL